jgi:hypothetical protein
MGNKQTATEWLFKKLWDEPKDKLTWYAILKQAKEMEKEQHDKTSLDWYLEGQSRRSNNKKWNSFQHYWEQTYGGN